MTVRNVREHHTRGLLPSPRLEGRKGTYDERHLARLQLIAELQGEGLNLRAISWLVERAPAEATEEFARFQRALFAPWQVEEPESYTVAELVAHFGSDPRHLERSLALGLLEPCDDGRYRAPTPSLLHAGQALVVLGVPVDAALDVVARLRRHADGIATDFTELFMTQVWRPFAAAGRPAEQWDRVREALEQLRPLASDVLLAVFQQAMATATARHLEQSMPAPQPTGAP